MAQQAERNTSRKKSLALIHMGAARLLGIDNWNDPDQNTLYRDWLEANTGQRSCKHLDAQSLARAVRTLRAAGALDSTGRGGRGADRPTDAQWARLAALAKERGWFGGLEDSRLRGFVRRTAKVDNTRFLTRQQMSQVITGLERWQ